MCISSTVGGPLNVFFFHPPLVHCSFFVGNDNCFYILFLVIENVHPKPSTRTFAHKITSIYIYIYIYILHVEKKMQYYNTLKSTYSEPDENLLMAIHAVRKIPHNALPQWTVVWAPNVWIFVSSHGYYVNQKTGERRSYPPESRNQRGGYYYRHRYTGCPRWGF